jgi:hypothetical protein
MCPKALCVFYTTRRITCPWPELEEYAGSFDLATLDDQHHKHVPYGELLAPLQTTSAAQLTGKHMCSFLQL